MNVHKDEGTGFDSFPVCVCVCVEGGVRAILYFPHILSWA